MGLVTKLIVAATICVSSANILLADKLLLDGSVSTSQRAAIEEGMSLGNKHLSSIMGFRPAEIKVVAGTDARFLTDNYLIARGLPNRYRKSKMQEFSSCEPAAEGAYRAIFLCLNSGDYTRCAHDKGGTRGNIIATVVHELMHVYQYELAGQAGKNCCSNMVDMSVMGPQWLVEGTAEYVKFEVLGKLGFHNFRRQMKWFRKQARSSGLSLAAIETRGGYYSAENRNDSSNLAPVGAEYVIKNYGYSALVKFWGEIGKRRSVDRAFKEAFGRTRKQFYQEFEADFR